MAPPHPPKPTSSPMMPNRAPTTIPARRANGEAHAPEGPNNTHLMENIPIAGNRKKQKRRQKQVARMAPDHETHNGHIYPAAAEHEDSAVDHPDVDDIHSQGDPDCDGIYYDEHESVDASHGRPTSSLAGVDDEHKVTGRKSKKKKVRKGRSDSHPTADRSSTSLSTHSASLAHPLPPPLPPHITHRTILKTAKDRSIWNTSTQEERENIKTFWLELGEEERRQLVKVEKDAVLKKMKEQQKHSCSCTVCGRKRTAIEEELEVLYDAYYEELEQYANTNHHDSFNPSCPIVPPPRLYQPPLRASGQHTRTQGQFHPSRNRVQELPEDDDGLEDEDDEEEEEDDESYSGEEIVDEESQPPRADFFAFGNSLTVKDGILTVADDLLKNDGKHFIDMMEQLAERRMQREEDTQYGIAAAHQSVHDGHNHGPLDEDDYDEEEDEEDYDSQEEEEYEEDEMDAMTEEQRMEEGRRMFQIFAARMFEQRVLTAYREKVAEQRQQKLIQELLEEETRNEQRTAKKAREAQKRKDKKKLQRQAKEDEKARREAEKAASEAAAKVEQERKQEEQRRKREEQRKKREAERKSQEEERARKEAEKQRRLHEERERHAEAERKQREQKEQEKRRREEARRKEQEEREARDKAAKEERERKVQEQARKENETAAKLGQDAKGHDKRRLHGKRPSQSGPVPIPSSLQHSQPSTLLVSPHHHVATPVVPKSSTPGRPRQSSHHGSHTSSPMSQPASAEQLSISPRSMPLSQSSAASSGASKQGLGQQQHMLHHPQPSAPMSPLGSTNRSHPPGFAGFSGLPAHPPGISNVVPRPPVGPEVPVYPAQPGLLMSQLRGGVPASTGIPPGFSGTRMVPSGRGFPFETGNGLPPHGQQPIPNALSPQQGGFAQTHSRQPSTSFEPSPIEALAQPFPISRPRPITRPSSTAPQDQRKYNHHTAHKDMDELSTQLGSSALLDGTDPPYTSSLSQSLPGATAPGSLPLPTRASFTASSMFTNPAGAPKHTNFPFGSGVKSSPWSSQPFGGFPGAPTWEVPPGSGWSNITLGSASHNRGRTPQVSPVEVRMYAIQACQNLNKGNGNFHDSEQVAYRVNQLRPLWEPIISVEEILDICDTEGNSKNGGGTFTVRASGKTKHIKFNPGPDNTSPISHRRGSSTIGEIGNPALGPNHPVTDAPRTFDRIGHSPSTTSTSNLPRQFSSPQSGF